MPDYEEAGDTMEGTADAKKKKSSALSYVDQVWAPMILLGPTLPAVVALITVVVGHVILLTDPIDTSATYHCGYPIDAFLSGAIASSYILLMVFVWTFIGSEVSFSVQGHKHTIIRPFRSLLWVVIAYTVPFITSFIIWIYGTWAVSLGALTCPMLNPALYAYDLFLVVTYWVGLGFALLYIIMAWLKAPRGGQGSRLEAFHERRHEAEKKEEKKMLDLGFKDHDEGSKGYLTLEEFEKFIGALGLDLPARKLKLAYADIDEAGEGKIFFDPFVDWYSKYTAEEADAN